MCRTVTVWRHGLSVAAAVAVLTACGGSGNDNAASSSSSTTPSSAAESSADAANSEFCTQAAAARAQLETAIAQSQSDLTSLPGSLAKLEAEVATVEPPEEIASDWNAYADLITRASAEISDIDFTAPNAAATLQLKLAPVLQQLGSLSSGVTDYLRDECGAAPLPSLSASPTS